MENNLPNWIYEVLSDLANFSRKNGLDELSCDLERVTMKHSGSRQDAELYHLIIDASFGQL